VTESNFRAGHPPTWNADLAAALAMISDLPLSKAEKAEAVRRLMKRDPA
jgi:hypothetical protein